MPGTARASPDSNDGAKAESADPPETVVPSQRQHADRDVELRFPRSDSPWLGVELRATEPQQPGVAIVRTLPGSPAERAGLQGGDVLLSLDGRTVATPRDVITSVQATGTGKTIPLAILRSGQQKLLRVSLAGKPEFEDQLRLTFVGKPAPEIDEAVTFQGDTASLRELRGEVVLLEFWASWCGVCHYLSPVLDDWYKSHRPLGLEVVGITDDPPGVGNQVAERTGMSYTLASDPKGKTQRAYLATQIPTLFVIDRQGLVRDVMVGLSRARLEEIEALVDELLQGGEK